ncbi:MAG: L-fucose/L-arabinose isomerase family protein [Candidatus Limnocylindrales bacterium]|jgi:L-fucose isomerase
MARIGLLSFSDGRDFVREETDPFVAEVEQRIERKFKGGGHEVRRAGSAIWSNETAVQEARAMSAWRPDLTIFSYPVWALPDLTILAAREILGPVMLFSSTDPKYRGLTGMLGAAGGLEQEGRRHDRVWGDIEDPAVFTRISQIACAAFAVRRLEGQTFGRIGGQSMGMYTAVNSPDRWISQFGIDVEEIDEWEIVRRSEAVDPHRARAGRGWLEAHATVHYDGKRLTPDLLERQIRFYHAVRELIDERHLDFTGIQGQPELTTHFCTTDIAEAFLNDPYDWEGPKAVHVCASEADMDGALTMQILHGLSGTPVLFADLRHYHADRGIWDLCNSGQHATWFAARSPDPAENLRRVHLYPADFHFPAGGASVHHLAAPGAFTFARLTHVGSRCRMQILRGRLEQYDAATNTMLMGQSTFTWPHAFARFTASQNQILARFRANHIHAVPGNFIPELRAACHMLDLDVDEIGDLEG